eukprot:9718311-Alexandrium_andersonii.AAC.1
MFGVPDGVSVRQRRQDIREEGITAIMQIEPGFADAGGAGDTDAMRRLASDAMVRAYQAAQARHVQG